MLALVVALAVLGARFDGTTLCDDAVGAPPRTGTGGVLPVTAFAMAGGWLTGPMAPAGWSAIWALMVEMTDAMPSRVSFSLMRGEGEASGLSISEVTRGGEAAMFGHAHGGIDKWEWMGGDKEQRKRAKELEGQGRRQKRGTFLLCRPFCLGKIANQRTKKN